MRILAKNGRVLLAAALSTVPGVTYAQDNVSTAANASTAASGNTATDPTLTDPVTTTTATGTANGLNTGAPMDDTLANDMALANTVQPEREEDNDFPWGLLGLAGLAGLLGRKRDDRHVNSQAGRRDL